jgi:nitrite reductase/ring-hydroxylating ferredoxin subunit
MLVLTVQHRGRYCALSATCTHLGAPLGEGIVVDGEVHCPGHHARFSVMTGEAVGAPAFSPLTRFSTTGRNGRIFITEDPSPLPDPSVPSAARVVIAEQVRAVTLARNCWRVPVFKELSLSSVMTRILRMTGRSARSSISLG